MKILLSLLLASSAFACVSPTCSVVSPTDYASGTFGSGAPYNALASADVRMEGLLQGSGFHVASNQWFAIFDGAKAEMNLRYTGGSFTPKRITIRFWVVRMA